MKAQYAGGAAAILMALGAHADNKSLDQLLQAATVDMPVTTAPATFLLGASGEAVPRLSSFRAFATQVGRAVDETGKIKNAIAVEIAPTLALRTTTWEDIERSQVMRILSRTTVSVATKAGGEAAPARSAIGLQSILYAPQMDAAIALSSNSKCTTAADAMDRSLPTGPDQRLKFTPETLALIDSCQKDIDALLTKWNQTMVAVGGGKVLSSSGGTGVKPKDAAAIWITAAYGGDLQGVGTKAEARLGYLLTAHWRRTRNAPGVSTTGVDAFADQKLTGLNFRFGNARLAGIAEYSRTRADPSQGLVFADRKRSVLGLEYKVDADMYLTVGVARDTGLSGAEQSVLAKLNWGFSKAPVLSTAAR